MNNLYCLWRKGLSITFLLFLSLVSFSQNNFLVSGKVTSAAGEPLAGVTVQVKNGTGTTTSKSDGSFQIKVPSGNAVLLFSYVGFGEQAVPVNNKQLLTVSLTPGATSLENVVVIGYGTQKKRNVTGAVTTMNAEKLDERPVTRVDQALVGQLAGVQVKQTSGALGRGFSVQVRGAGSISGGNEPLYVIDGFPLATAAPNASGNFASGNPLDNINPNDIASIQVLKDASAAAIYGSRAANGVVIVTTKRGKSGKAVIGLNSFVGYSEASRQLDMLNGEEWIDRASEMINAQWVASGPNRTASQTTEQRRQILGLPAGQVNTGLMIDDRWLQPGYPGLRLIDWQKEAFRKGLMQNHQVTASGGNNFAKYYISGNYSDQEGMVINTNSRTYSTRANIEVNANEKLRFGLNIAPTFSLINDPGVEGKDNILHQLVSMTPVQEDTMGLYHNVGNNGQYRWSSSPNSPIGKLEQIVGQTKRFRTLTSIFGEYQILKGLSFKTTANLDNSDNNTKTYVPYTVTGNVNTRQQNLSRNTSGTFSGLRKQTFVNENTLSFDRTIGQRHEVSLLGGASYNTTKLDFFRLASNSNFGFNSSVITTLNSAAAAGGVVGETTESRDVLISYFSRLQYGLDGKYLFSATIRKDGSSRFGENTKWGTFPSASVGWRISEESFMQNIRQISDLKFRASWGLSGNYEIPLYATVPRLSGYNYTLGGSTVIGQAPSGIANPDLTWEKSSMTNIGLDAGLFNNRLAFSFDIYSRTTSSLLLNVPVAGITGFQSVLSNAGSVRNNGWELEMTSRNTTRQLQWTTSANFSHNRNKVLALAGDQTQILIPSSFDIPHSILRVGDPLYSIYVVKQIGILSKDDISKGVALYGSQTVGDPRYFDANADGVIDANDRVIVGKPNPSYTWGVTNTFRYKGFDLSFLVQGQWGGHIYSLLGRALGRTGQGFSDNALGFYRDRWRSPENPGAGVVGKAYSTFGRIKNTDWLYSSDYWRVRNINLGYNLGNVLKSKQISNARIYVTAENFFGKDKYKGGFNPEATNTNLSGSNLYPEAGDYGGLPLPRSLILGVNFTF